MLVNGYHDENKTLEENFELCGRLNIYIFKNNKLTMGRKLSEFKY